MRTVELQAHDAGHGAGNGRARGTMVGFGRRTLLTLILVLTAIQGSAGLSDVEVLAAPAEPSGPPGPPRPPDAPGPSGPPGPAGPPAPVATFYLSPSGNDSNPGSSPERPWRTFTRAFNPAKPLRPGDVLVLLDGTYTPSTTALPQIDCSSSGNARSGTEGSPIVMRAANERRAHLKSDGSREALRMSNCQYWTLSGLYASNTDNSAAPSSAGSVFQFTRNVGLRLERLLAVRPNRTCPNDSLPYCNSHALELVECKNVVIEESEAYDFHRHGFSIFRSRDVVVRRSYANSRGHTQTLAQATGLILYGSSRSIVENMITEDTGGINIAGSGFFDGIAGGYENLIVGSITLRNWYGSTVRARRFGDDVYPVGDNTIRNSVYALSTGVGLYARGAADTLLENVTFFGTRDHSALKVDEDLGEGAPCSANPKGCSFTARNVLFLGNKGPAYQIKSEVVRPWLIEFSNSFGNIGGNYPASDAPEDESGNVRFSRSVEPQGMGLGRDQCLLWVPDGSNMKGAGKGGADIGASILYRSERGQPTRTPLWDPTTGRFSCGAVVAGVNDVPGSSCIDVHERLNVNRNGCHFPANYP